MPELSCGHGRAGNIWRAKQVPRGPLPGHYMGLLATVINSIALKDVIIRRGAGQT